MAGIKVKRVARNIVDNLLDPERDLATLLIVARHPKTRQVEPSQRKDPSSRGRETDLVKSDGRIGFEGRLR